VLAKICGASVFIRARACCSLIPGLSRAKTVPVQLEMEKAFSQ
jgi:hypothetical protein